MRPPPPPYPATHTQPGMTHHRHRVTQWPRQLSLPPPLAEDRSQLLALTTYVGRRTMGGSTPPHSGSLSYGDRSCTVPRPPAVLMFGRRHAEPAGRWFTRVVLAVACCLLSVAVGFVAAAGGKDGVAGVAGGQQLRAWLGF